MERFVFTEDLQEQKVGWMIIGAMTGAGSERHKPQREWVDFLAQTATEKGVPVLMKDSLVPIVGEENMLREFPWAQRSGEAQER